MINPHDPNSVCILWHPDASPPSDSLIAQLTDQGFSVLLAPNMHTCFAGACRAVKAESAAPNRVVIVLDQRDSLVGVDRVLDGLDRFAPAVIVWEHTPGANPSLSPIVRTEVPIPQSVAQPVPQPVTHTEPNPTPLRLVADNQQAPKPARSTPLSSSDVLNADELDALLASELGDEKR